MLNTRSQTTDPLLQKADSSCAEQLVDCAHCSARRGVVYVDQLQVCPYHQQHHSTSTPHDALDAQPPPHLMHRVPYAADSHAAMCPLMTSSLNLCSRHRVEEYVDDSMTSHPTAGHVHNMAASPTTTTLTGGDGNELDLIRTSVYQDAVGLTPPCWTRDKCPCIADMTAQSAL